MRRWICVLLMGLPVAEMRSQETFQELVDAMQLNEDTLDVSFDNFVQMAEPRLAYIDITGVKQWPSSKSSSQKGWMEFYDGRGLHFKKPILMKGQGNYSLKAPKKNASFTLCDENWDEAITSDLQIGDWVVQDAFHLKAFYTDYIRGIGEVGYKVYERMVSDRLPFWVRGGYDHPSEARCFPDGFPCIVYFNHKFHGIYAFQLKKSRKNMNQKKHDAKHIHLDGNIKNATLFDGAVSWTQFEVRTPNDLYDALGMAYSGLSPRELIDDKNEFYKDRSDDDDVVAAKQRSNEVKRNILRLSKYNQEISNLVRNGSTDSEIKSAIERRFDIESLIDYYILYYLQFNCDGSLKNWQWFTYDGIKWMVTPYDLDQTFGINLYGVVRPAYMNLEDLVQGPFKWMKSYYRAEIQQRYYHLRDNGLIDDAVIRGFIHDWTDRVGEKFYALEMSRWPDSPCYHDVVCASGWKAYDNWTEYATAPAFDAKKTYAKGDVVKYEGRLWQATQSVTSNKPYTFNGNIDSIERLDEWVTTRINCLDDLWGYTPGSGITRQPNAEKKLDGIYTLDGRKVENPVGGILIYHYSDGSSRVSVRKVPR